MTAANTHIHHVDVTFDLLDPGNVLYHANYLVLAERARAAAFEELEVPVHRLWSDGYALLVRGLSIEYRRPVFAGAKLAVVTTVRAASDSRLEVVQRFFLRSDRTDSALGSKAGQAVCKLSAELVCASLVKRCVDVLPAPLLRALALGDAGTDAGAAP